MATTTLGGKLRRAPASRFFLKAGEALLEEALAPLADDLSWSIEPCGDTVVVQTLGSVEDDLGADHITIR
jgi:hypothetical protein